MISVKLFIGAAILAGASHAGPRPAPRSHTDLAAAAATDAPVSDSSWLKKYVVTNMMTHLIVRDKTSGAVEALHDAVEDGNRGYAVVDEVSYGPSPVSKPFPWHVVVKMRVMMMAEMFLSLFWPPRA